LDLLLRRLRFAFVVQNIKRRRKKKHGWNGEAGSLWKGTKHTIYSCGPV